MVPVFIEDPEKTSNSVEAIFDDTSKTIKKAL